MPLSDGGKKRRKLHEVVLMGVSRAIKILSSICRVQGVGGGLISRMALASSVLRVVEISTPMVRLLGVEAVMAVC